MERVSRNDICKWEAPKLGELRPSSTPQFRPPCLHAHTTYYFNFKRIWQTITILDYFCI